MVTMARERGHVTGNPHTHPNPQPVILTLIFAQPNIYLALTVGYSERMAKRLVRDMLSSLIYLHAKATACMRGCLLSVPRCELGPVECAAVCWGSVVEFATC